MHARTIDIIFAGHKSYTASAIRISPRGKVLDEGALVYEILHVRIELYG